MDYGLRGQVAIITGSTSGIGLGLAEVLAQQGVNIVLNGLGDPEAIEATRASLSARNGVEVLYHDADMTQPHRITDLVSSTRNAFGRLDILVNNAGMSQVGTEDIGREFADLSHAEWRAGIDQNLDLAFNVTSAAHQAITDSGHGRVIFVTSVTGPMVSAPGNPAYSAAKAGLDGLMRALAIELGPTGTTVNSVNPGWIHTASATGEEVRAGHHTPVGRPGTADEVAAAVLMLAAPEASYITGQTLVVDGGNIIQEIKGS